eukprot:Nitzschia sp. Nitz4//scaffold98_size77359//59410//60321//NITZ4_005555-RA/size77359-processed-gene-0.127-mRNA-1//1//CDS//3329560778//2907//frame0
MTTPNPTVPPSSKGTPKYKMVALDLDGTTLTSSHTMADEQAAYLRHILQLGITVCFATGRSAPSVYEHVQKLDSPKPLPVVCSNGARGFHIDTHSLDKQELFFDPVSLDVFRKALAIAKEKDWAVQFYHEDSIFVNSTKPKHVELSKEYMRLTGSQVIPVDDDFEHLVQQNHLPSKVLVLFDDSFCEEANALYTSSLGSEASVVRGFPWFLEVLNPAVTKGTGLKKLCEHLSIPMEECIAIGDGNNDVEFVSMAGLGLAMKNAEQGTKDAADQVLEWTNDELGVMKALKQLEETGMLVAPAAN